MATFGQILAQDSGAILTQDGTFILSQDGPESSIEQLFVSVSAATNRVYPDEILTKEFAAGEDLLPVLTPLAFDLSSGFWVVWTYGGSNGTGTIRGFVFPNAIQLLSSPVLGDVMLRGQVHRDDIPLPPGESLSSLDSALRAQCRNAGLYIDNLDSVR